MRSFLEALAIAVLALGPIAACAAKQESPRMDDPGHAPEAGRPGSEADRPPPEAPAETKLATFGGGCFWCTEAIFLRVDGVTSVESGYSGGTVDNPTYDQVCAGDTGHAEAIQIRYDPAKVSYTDLLEIFFKTHDPTSLNRQGADVGTQYRSVIFTHDAEQKAIAARVKSKLDKAGIWEKPIVTQIVDYERFWPAGEYHQDYYGQNPNAGYCRMVIQPKVAKFEKLFAEKLRK